MARYLMGLGSRARRTYVIDGRMKLAAQVLSMASKGVAEWEEETRPTLQRGAGTRNKTLSLPIPPGPT